MKLFYHIDKECSRFIIYQNVSREVYDKGKHVYLFIFITTINNSLPFSIPLSFSMLIGHYSKELCYFACSSEKNKHNSFVFINLNPKAF